MPRVVHFEIGVDDPKRAVKFYTDVFGWKVDQWQTPQGPMDYWLVTTGQAPEAGIDGALMPRSNYPQAIVNTISVPSVDDFVRKIQAAGGKIIQPKMPIPTIGYFATCRDTEGNFFGIMESDPKAH
jgi:predicted enzyme related to lactoylglutathione lyase